MKTIEDLIFDLTKEQAKFIYLELIKIHSNKGDTILDCFAGSGTALLAAKELGINFLGCEKDPIYFELASKRLEC
ncbi:hypothetical protein EELLY_v1c07840 [Entomoplasma ellychniae]|uniref:DNA methylase N-4/N-6 domain-containing protein n=1 Tax=Entomoplasma ellychniae TaxID=2114 RepID=A0A8E2QWR4_9MOLU|nr:DNA methyltransferase [Entomoplasma ellychniae]PPE05096.1 hypothetical protein EELLY_v1c07840 [Entomoplasma ellychniae]